MTTALETRAEVGDRRDLGATGPRRTAAGHHSAATAQTEVPAPTDLPAMIAPLAATDQPVTIAPLAGTALPETIVPPARPATTDLRAANAPPATPVPPAGRRTEGHDRATQMRLSARQGPPARRGPTEELTPPEATA